MDQDVQVSAPVYAMGDAEEDIIESFGLLETDVRECVQASKSLQKHFMKRHNPIASICPLWGKMISDRLVVGQNS